MSITQNTHLILVEQVWRWFRSSIGIGFRLRYSSTHWRAATFYQNQRDQLGLEQIDSDILSVVYHWCWRSQILHNTPHQRGNARMPFIIVCVWLSTKASHTLPNNSYSGPNNHVGAFTAPIPFLRPTVWWYEKFQESVISTPDHESNSQYPRASGWTRRYATS